MYRKDYFSFVSKSECKGNGCFLYMWAEDGKQAFDRLPTTVRKIDIVDFIDCDDDMASVTIRKLPDEVKERLRVDAAKSGTSLEAYAREILKEASSRGGMRVRNLAQLARECFGADGGVELELPERGSNRGAVDFG